jgi:hypothetical protein
MNVLHFESYPSYFNPNQHINVEGGNALGDMWQYVGMLL